MMKQEFEQLIGKEVDFDTFEMYNAMYIALPESVNKFQFVQMLNINEIPESPGAVARRKERELFITQIKQKINELKSERDDLQNEMTQFCYPTYCKRRTKEINAEIKQLHYIIK